MAGKKQIPAAEYKQYPLHYFRDKRGNLYYVYMDIHDQDGPVYIKQVADHVRIDKVTSEQWGNAILNHGMYEEEETEEAMWVRRSKMFGKGVE
jgi:hypothetical protein